MIFAHKMCHFLSFFIYLRCWFPLFRARVFSPAFFFYQFIFAPTSTPCAEVKQRLTIHELRILVVVNSHFLPFSPHSRIFVGRCYGHNI